MNRMSQIYYFLILLGVHVSSIWNLFSIDMQKFILTIDNSKTFPRFLNSERTTHFVYILRIKKSFNKVHKTKVLYDNNDFLKNTYNKDLFRAKPVSVQIYKHIIKPLQAMSCVLQRQHLNDHLKGLLMVLKQGLEGAKALPGRDCVFSIVVSLQSEIDTIFTIKRYQIHIVFIITQSS